MVRSNGFKWLAVRICALVDEPSVAMLVDLDLSGRDYDPADLGDLLDLVGRRFCKLCMAKWEARPSAFNAQAGRIGFVAHDAQQEGQGHHRSLIAVSPLAFYPTRFGGNIGLVFIDTSAAMFQGDDENSNPLMLKHAKLKRKLCELPGRPCVVSLNHPPSTLRSPRCCCLAVGGAYLNEVDGNFAAWGTRPGSGRALAPRSHAWF
jgi:hypothetical protein